MYICNQPATATTNGLIKQRFEFNSKPERYWLLMLSIKETIYGWKIGPLVTITEHL